MGVIMSDTIKKAKKIISVDDDTTYPSFASSKYIRSVIRELVAIAEGDETVSDFEVCDLCMGEGVCPNCNGVGTLPRCDSPPSGATSGKTVQKPDTEIDDPESTDRYECSNRDHKILTGILQDWRKS